MKKPAAVATALLTASTVPVVAGCIMAPPPDLGSLLLAIVVYMFACIFTTTFGLPTYLLLDRLHLVRWWSATGVGLIGGAIIGQGLWKPYGSPEIDVPVMTVIGAITALVFWMVVRVAARKSPSIG